MDLDDEEYDDGKISRSRGRGTHKSRGYIVHTANSFLIVIVSKNHAMAGRARTMGRK